jgi:hypothetical protein
MTQRFAAIEVVAAGGSTEPALSVSGGMAQKGGTCGFFGKTPAAQPAAYTQTFATADRTIDAYTADAETSVYTGDAGGVATISAAANVAKLADLNALRVAYENLRALTEDTTKALNAVIDDLQSLGLLR